MTKLDQWMHGPIPPAAPDGFRYPFPESWHGGYMVCETCAALTYDPEGHRGWHEEYFSD